ncbi:transglycosylase domain-containing protein [Natranaerofaba carboxydovora]|uniref:transglycosylase domain-containing protein n=1 Tax=Natranaerofaba carboxydovora TaxID=2742683 RepID=UPI001F1320CF|nr:PBP1A family penicillin-binding protein [Natranaerofaba carboxydovora]UMZ74035.1 Penicillin-binding protein 2D [Natranaerofaba carboxydovora]
MTRFILILLMILLVVAGGGLGYFVYVVYGMEDVTDIESPQTSRFYYQDKEIMTNQYVENRTKVSLDDIAEELKWATIAVEDRRFYEHNGFDLIGIGRAASQNLLERQITQGGSTITQQLAKNLFLSHDRTWQRKLDEAAITIQLERELTKDEIMEKYLNTIYYGHATYGIEAASNLFFDKSASELSLGEAAMLAGLPRGPGYYSPFINEEAAYRRQKVVLKLMKEEGYITEKQLEEALDEEIEFIENPSLSRESNYVVEQILSKELDDISKNDPEIIQNGGLDLYTTIDSEMQSVAERILQEEVENLRKDEQGITQPQGALIALEPDTGKIRALVGGRDYQETSLNRVNLPRSPGSAFKPFVYAAAMENGYTAVDTFHCGPISLHEDGMDEPYEPTDFDGGYHNEDLTLREAFAQSCNITAVKLNQEVGGDNTVEMAARLGVDSHVNNYLSTPLGTSEVTLLELTAAYAAFANGGYRIEPMLLDSVIGPDGEELVNNSSQLDKVLDESVAYLITDLMKDVVQDGTASGVSMILDRPAAGKTGTSQNFKNVYMVGYTPDLVVGLFIGDDAEVPLEATGGNLAAPLWAEFINEALDTPAKDFDRPDDIVEFTICSETGLIQSSDCTIDGEEEIFIRGTEPDEDCSYADCPHIEEPSWWQWDFWW